MGKAWDRVLCRARSWEGPPPNPKPILCWRRPGASEPCTSQPSLASRGGCKCSRTPEPAGLRLGLPRQHTGPVLWGPRCLHPVGHWGQCLAWARACSVSISWPAYTEPHQGHRPLWRIPTCRVLASLARTREKRRGCLLTQDTKQTPPPSQGHQTPVRQSPPNPVRGANAAAGRSHRLRGGTRRVSTARKSSHLLYLQLPRRFCWAPRPLARPARPWRLYLSTSS